MFNSATLTLLGFIAASAAAAATGATFRPTAWYDRIEKPGWTPPNWMFPVVWTVLYLFIAVAGWLVWRRVGFAPVPFGLFAAQLVLNAAWSPLFFGLKRPDLAFADLLLLWLAIAATLTAFAPIDSRAAILLAPYLAWVTLAGALNLSIWRRNRHHFART